MVNEIIKNSHECEEGICPICGGRLIYGSARKGDDFLYRYDIHCVKCDFSGFEDYELRFIGMTYEDPRTNQDVIFGPEKEHIENIVDELQKNRVRTVVINDGHLDKYLPSLGDNFVSLNVGEIGYEKAVKIAFRMKPSAIIFDFTKISIEEAQKFFDMAIAFDFPNVYALCADKMWSDWKQDETLPKKKKEEKIGPFNLPTVHVEAEMDEDGELHAFISTDTSSGIERSNTTLNKISADVEDTLLTYIKKYRKEGVEHE